MRPLTLPEGGSPATAGGDFLASGIGTGSKRFNRVPIGMSVQEWVIRTVAVRTSRFALSARPVLALDLGGTQIRAAVVLPDGGRVARVATETPKAQGPEAVVRACLESLRMSRARAPRQLADGAVGIGVSSPGPIDPWRGIIIEPPNLGPEFHDIEIAAPLEAALGLPVYLERDTNVAALAEEAFGAARDCPDFLYMTVSTGIGGAIVSEGRILYGPDATAGELGHVPVNLDGPVCGCGGTSRGVCGRGRPVSLRTRGRGRRRELLPVAARNPGRA